MKTAGLTTMLSTVLLLLASLAAESSALALRPYMFGEGLADGEQGAADDSQYSQRQRDTRAVQPDIQTVSDYAITVLKHRQSWKNSNCQTTFNCAPVSSQHCGDSNNELVFFSPNKSKYWNSSMHHIARCFVTHVRILCRSCNARKIYLKQSTSKALKSRHRYSH